MIFLLSIAMASDLPTRPEPVENECAIAIPAVYGQQPSEDFVEPSEFVYSCSAVIVPTSQVAHLLAVHTWAEAAEAEIALARSEPLLDWRGYASIGFAVGAIVGVYIGSY